MQEEENIEEVQPQKKNVANVPPTPATPLVTQPTNESFVGFEVTEDTKTTDFVRFDIEGQYKKYKAGELDKNGEPVLPFHFAYLTEVKLREVVKSKDYTLLPGVELEAKERPTADQVTPDSLRATLSFHFVDPSGVCEHYHTIWDILPGDDKAKTKQRGIAESIGHFWNALSLKNDADKVFNSSNYATVLGHPAKSWRDVFEAVATLFNTGNGGEPIYYKEGKPLPLRIKLVYGQNGDPELPFYGNKIERYLKGMPSTLQVKKDDKFIRPEKPAGPSIAGPTAASAENEDWANANFG